MPNVATVLKEEISRLARKEAKAMTEATRKASARHRREIAELKRQVKKLTRQVDTLASQERRRAPGSTATGPQKKHRFSASGLRSHRERLGLAAADVADLLGVSTQTIYNWEQGRSRPSAEHVAALAELRTMGKREVQRRLELLEA